MRKSKITKITTCLLASAFFMAPTNLVAAPKWKKVNVSAGSSGGGGNGTVSNLFNCVSIIDSTKDIPAAAAAALVGVQINYSMVGGAGGSAGSALGSNGTVVAGSFTVSNQRYQFYVGGGGGGNPTNAYCAGGGGSSAIVSGGSSAIAVARGGDGGGNVGSGGGTSGGTACVSNSNFSSGGGYGYYGGGGSTAGSHLNGGGCGPGGGASGYGQAGGEFGAGGNGKGTAGINCARAAITMDGADLGGKGSVNWLNQTLPSLPAMAGRANGAGYGGNAGAIILSYTATSCLF